MDLLFFLLATFFSLALGSKLLTLLRLHEKQTSQEIFLSFGCGWLIIAVLTTILGFSHAVHSWIFVSVALVGVVVLWRELFEMGVCLVSAVRVLFDNTFLLLVGVLIALPLAADLLTSLAPPTYCDALLYHLELPRQYLRAHKVCYIPSIFYSSMPQYVEMVYLFGYALRGEIVSQLLGSSFSPLFALGVYAMIRRKGTRVFAALGALAFVSLSPVALFTSVAYVDIQTAFFAFLSTYLLLKFLEAYRREWLLLSALSAGLAAGAKLTSLLLLAAIPVILLFALPREIRRLRLIGLFVGVSTLIAVPWYLHAYVNTGNPIFPYFYEIIGGRDWNSLSNSFMMFLVDRPHYGSVSSVKELLLFLWSLFGGTRRTSLVLLAFLPLVPFTLRIGRELKIILAAAAASLLVTAFLVVHQKFHVFPFALLLIPCALAAASLSRMGKYTKYLCYLIFVLSLAFGLQLRWERHGEAIRSVVEREDRESYLQRSLPDYDAMQWMNKNLPSGSKVLLWAFSGYYLDHDYLWMGPLRQGLIDFTKVNSPEKLIRRMEELEITHVHYSPGHLEVVIPKGLGSFPDMDSLHAQIERDFLTKLVDIGKAEILEVDYERKAEGQ